MFAWLFGRKNTGGDRITIWLGPRALKRIDRMQERLGVRKRIDVLRRALIVLDLVLEHCGNKPFTVVSADGRSVRIPSLSERRLRVVGGRDVDGGA